MSVFKLPLVEKGEGCYAEDSSLRLISEKEVYGF